MRKNKVSAFSERSDSPSAKSTACLVVAAPQRFRLNVDTFCLSGQSSPVLVSCTLLPAGWELPDPRPPGRQTKLCEEVRLGVLTSIYCVGLAGPAYFQVEMDVEECGFRRVSWQTEGAPPSSHPEAKIYPKSELLGQKQITWNPSRSQFSLL